jgi:hypothetical protein
LRSPRAPEKVRAPRRWNPYPIVRHIRTRAAPFGTPPLV